MVSGNPMPIVAYGVRPGFKKSIDFKGVIEHFVDVVFTTGMLEHTSSVTAEMSYPYTDWSEPRCSSWRYPSCKIRTYFYIGTWRSRVIDDMIYLK